MSISWPIVADFPQYFLIGTVTGGPKDVAIRTEVAQGPSRVRSRYAIPEENFQGTLLFPTNAAFLAWREFWTTTLVNGTQAFDWVHPLTLANCSCRFVGSYSDNPQTPGSTVHRVTVSVEVLP